MDYSTKTINSIIEETNKIYNSVNVEMVSTLNEVFSFPYIDSGKIWLLSEKVLALNRPFKSLIRLESPVIVVGDLHGHILDLIRIIQKCGFPEDFKMLFLGDYIDRGDFSIETIILLFSLKIQYPDNVILLKGNHEFSCSKLTKDAVQFYNDESISNVFCSVFNELPVAAIIDNEIFCVHGGIGPDTSLKGIEMIGQTESNNLVPYVNSLLWSDPIANHANFQSSRRGNGYQFGQMGLDSFLLSNDLSLIIRAHECVYHGVEYSLNNKVITVFSASNYCGRKGNSSAIIKVLSDKTLDILKFPPLNYLPHSSLCYQNENYQFNLPTKSSQNPISKIHKFPLFRRMPEMKLRIEN